MRMKKLALLSIGMLAFALQPANAQTSLFTTYDDFSAFTAGWSVAPSADNTFSTDASTVNGIGNLTAPGGAGTSGSLIIGPVNGWLDAATGPSQGGNPAFLQAIDPGSDGINAVNYSGNIYMDYSLPDNEGGTYFDVGVLFQYAGNGYFGTFFGTSSTDLGYTDPLNGGEVYQATIPYTITGGSAFSGFGFGIMAETDFNSALPFHVDNITVQTVPEPGTIALTGLGLAGLALIRRRRQS